MLVTTCGQCGARFRVTPEQLNLNQGQVRCGQCHQAFNGYEALERFAGDEYDARARAAAPRESGAPDARAEAEEVELGKRTSGPAEPAPSAQAQSTAPADLRNIPDLADEIRGPNAPASAADGAPTTPAASRASTSAGLAYAEPYLATPAARPARAWAFGVALLCLVMGLELAFAFRATLARHYPESRPFLESTCAALHCTVPWPNDEAALKLEESELLEIPGSPGQISLQARFRNLSSSSQEYPHVELTLTDVSGQTAVRRVLSPADYVGRALAPGEVMAAGAETMLSLRLETGRIRPTGYELLLFYP